MFILFLFLLSQVGGTLRVLQEIPVPLDHNLPESKTIRIEIEFLNDFDPEKGTVLMIEDAFDLEFRGLDIKNGLFNSFNFVLVKGRKASKDLLEWLERNGEIDYSEAYSLLNQDQVARDLDVIRKKLVLDQKVQILGYSASGLTMLRYSTLFPDRVKSLLVFSPLLFEVQSNLSFWTSINQIVQLKENYDSTLIRDFAWYSSYDIESFPMQEKEELLGLALFDFFKNRGMYPSPDLNRLSLAYQVRAFELSFGLKSNLTNNTTPIIYSLEQESASIWKGYAENRFPVFGIKYDQGLNYKGKLTIIGSAFDLLVSQKSYDVLAEFYSNRTLILLNDAHSFSRLESTGLTPDLLEAFLKDDFNEKVKVYSELENKNLIYRESDNRKYRVPRWF